MTASLTDRDDARRLGSPPLQGRGRGWGVAAWKIDELQGYAAENRRNPTVPEKRLWSALSRSQLGGYKFRGQAAIGPFIADFLCPQKRLVVEVDGETHLNPSSDASRTARLEMLGYKVLRVINSDVMQNLEGALWMVLNALEALPERRAPHPNPSPEGEGLEADSAQKLLGIPLEGSAG